MSLSGRIRTSAITTLITGVGALFAAGCGLLSTASPAAASSSLQSMFEIPGIGADATDNLQVLRYLGVDIVRLPLVWNEVAANPTSRTQPATNPYPGSIDYSGTFEPSASAYGQFVQAAATHFSSVHFWEVWNEPNWGPSLTPQYLGGSSVPASATIYRGLFDAGWGALHSTGHAHDTIIIAGLSQDGSSPVGETGTTAPLTFTRALYCLSGSYRPLTGASASAAGCPTSPG